MIKPATLAQVRKAKDGRMITVDGDVLDIAKQLQAISPKLRLRWSEAGNHFCVYERDEHRERLVLTSQELTPQIVERVRQIAHPSYDYLAEIERLDKAADKAKDQKFHEEAGEIGEHLAHALRKDLQAKNKVVLPRGVDG